MTERFMIDDCGTLIDIETRNTYDYVSEVCPLLNELHNDKEHTINLIKEALANERTRIGQSVLKQLLNQME